MTPGQRRELVRELHPLLKTMDLPSFRTQQMSEANLRWLQRNIAVNNADHPDLSGAVDLIKRILSKSN